MTAQDEVETLSPLERRLLLALKGGPGRPEDAVSKGGFEQMVEVMNAASWLRSKGYLKMHEDRIEWFELGEEGKGYVDSKLPETRLVKLLEASNGKVPMKAIRDAFPKDVATAAVGVLVEFGARIRDGVLQTDDLAKLKNEIACNQETLEKVGRGERDADPKVIARMVHRGKLLKKRERFERMLELTERGLEAAGKVVLKEEVSQLTPELIITGKYREVEFRRYDVRRFAPSVHGAKRHPMMQIADEVREAFMQMGFTEIDDDIIQPAFWNMDALFVPQDHPARDIQDSFYVDIPPAKLDDDDVARIEKAHLGKGYGTRGWGERWSREEASRFMLRTHTTVATIRHLAKRVSEGDDAVRAFTIGRCYRRDPFDPTHLSEFTQVDGIVMEEGANLKMLIGTLQEFFRRIGIPAIRVKPGYFPFTEPSLEVLLKFGDGWMEGVGAGIFRPEVTEPWGIKHPVLAWGAGLERMAMTRYGIDDIRRIYLSDIQWLRERKLV
jgi:phenylalanyl-tRNA synthetase alpha chain